MVANMDVRVSPEFKCSLEVLRLGRGRAPGRSGIAKLGEVEDLKPLHRGDKVPLLAMPGMMKTNSLARMPWHTNRSSVIPVVAPIR